MQDEHDLNHYQRHVTESIATFLDAAREQELEALGVRHVFVALLDRLNAAFNKLSDEPIGGPALSVLLLSQAHGAFLAATRIGLGGQVHVAYMALRGSIESSLYALIMKNNEASQAIWVNRQTDRAACRKTFTAQAGLSLLSQIDPLLERVIRTAYETTIDRGAHPNLLALAKHLDFEEWDQQNRIANVLLLPPDGLEVEEALRCCVVVGAAVASLCAHVLPDHSPAVSAKDEAMTVVKQYLAIRIEDDDGLPLPRFAEGND